MSSRQCRKRYLQGGYKYEGQMVRDVRSDGERGAKEADAARRAIYSNL